MYSREVTDVLKEKKISVGDRIEVRKDFRTYTGILMPRIEMGDRNCLVIKMENGYNVGLRLSKDTEISLVSRSPREEKKEPPEVRHDPAKPKISVLSMGGTIASKVDYKTGGVTPRFSASDLIEYVPNLASLANIHGRQVDSVLSGNMNFGHYKKLIREIEKEIKNGCEGIIVTHGTDTMHYTACALAFALEDLPVPVLLVGSQRSTDRGSSDGPMNLVCAVQFITKTDFAEVAICMHATESDDFCFIHPACKARKMHTSTRDAFRTINSSPWALVSPEGEIRFFSGKYRKKDRNRKMKVRNKFEDRVAFLKRYPNMDAKMLDFFVKSRYKGLVIEGTGMGHIPEELNGAIKKFTKKGIAVVTSQCINGRINMNVYSYGRQLEEAGVVSGEDMLAEVAYIKLAWLLGNYKDMEEIKMLMGKNLRGEINDRSEF